MRFYRLLLLIGFFCSLSACARSNSPVNPLPAEVYATLTLIDQNGPYPYKRDGITFNNFERRLPDKPRGYYREYTVSTPGRRDRGARRIITGGFPPVVFYYTNDHYRSFQVITR